MNRAWVRVWVRVWAIAIAVAMVAACGKSQAEKEAEEAAKAAEAATKGLEQMAKGLEAMASGKTPEGDQKPVDPVSFRDMQALFPEIDGWTKGKPTGERMTQPFAFSQAEVDYTKGDARIEMKLVDSGFNQLLLTPYAMFLQAGYEKETESGYEKSTTVAGQPGWEKWDTEGKSGELNALVGKRFLLTLEGSQIDDAKVLHEIAGKVDMGRLAALK